MPPASHLVTTGFVILPLLVAAGFVVACEWAGRRLGESGPTRRRRVWAIAVGTAVWMLLTDRVASTGILRAFDATPPPFAGLVLGVLVLGIGVPLSPIGKLLARGLPLAVLVGSQVFRLPLELLMHRAHVEGVMPVQMSYSGRNFDIVTGITAGLLGLWLARSWVPRWIIALWNLLGLALLVNVVVIAILSTPPFHRFGPERLNTFVTYPPFVWLPAVLVLAALIGHLLVWRRLTEERSPVP